MSLSAYNVFLFSKEFSSFFIGLFVALLILPKGKIIAASVITGLSTLLLIMTIFAMLFFSDTVGYESTLASAFNLLACITVLILTFKQKVKMDFSKLDDLKIKPLIIVVSIIGILLSLTYIGTSSSAPELGLPKFLGYVGLFTCFFVMLRKKKANTGKEKA